MPLYLCRLFLVHSRLIWTESYYLAVPSPAQAMTALRALAQARTLFLPNSAQIARLRISDEILKGYAYHDAAPAGGVHDDSWPPQTALQVTLLARAAPGSQVYRRQLLLRGMPKSFWIGTPAGPETISPTWRSEVQIYLDTLVQYGFSLRAMDKGQPEIPIIGIERYATEQEDCAGNPLDAATLPESDSQVAIATSRPHGIPLIDPGTSRYSRVRVSRNKWRGQGVGHPPSINGQHELSGAFGSLLTWTGELPEEGEPIRMGSVRWSRMGTWPITSWQLGPAKKRSTGGLSKYTGVLPALNPPPPASGAEPIPPPTQTLQQSPLSAPGGPAASTISTYRDLIRAIYDGYAVYPDGLKRPIGIAEVLSLPDTYLVALSGTDLEADQATGISSDITASLGQPDHFAEAIVYAINDTVPVGATLILAGHSLGGMESQNCVPDLLGLGYRVSTVVTFGSPMTIYPTDGVNYIRFAARGDFVPSLSALGALLALAGHPEQTWISDPNVSQGPWDAHTRYQDQESLDLYDAYGVYTPGGHGHYLDLGPYVRIQAPNPEETGAA